MEKLVTLNISGEFDKGFVVQAEVRQDGGTTKNQVSLAIAAEPGKLPACPELLEQYRHWQSLYNNLEDFFPNRLKKKGKVTNSSKDEAFAACKAAAKLLAETLNDWLLRSPDFQPIVNLLSNNLQDSTHTRILLATENHWLRRLPWCEWNLLEDIPNAEIVLASPKFKQVESSGKLPKKEKVKILVILGDNAGTDADEDVIKQLIPDAEICWLKEPQRRDLDAPLWDKQWDILFFAGHGKTESDGSIGKIQINSKDTLTIDEIKSHLKKAINNGLKLAIFNACDGLGIAYQLAEGEDLYLPQIIVMREILPIAIAPKFLRFFLEAYTRGLSLSTAIRDSRKRLQILEGDVPCVSWLPVLCQNPAEIPLRWQDLVIPPNPYQGLSAFQEKDAALFFGRETFTNQLVKVVETKKLVAVIGASGSGKSSVVLAGLIPSLRQQGHWLIAQLRPESTPFENLAKALLSSVAQLETGESEVIAEVNGDKINLLAADLQEGNRTLSDVVKNIGSSRRFLLVIDQFEEIYTYQTQKSRQFLDCLLDAVQNLSAFRLVITLRADFMSQAIKYNLFGEQLNKWKPELILGMTRTELQAVIEEPAKQRNVYLEAGLTEHILNDVGDEQGNLPLLEFALAELWKQQENGLLTRLKYDEIGGVENALCRHAEGVYDKLSQAEQQRAKRIFLKLVSPGEGTEYTRKIATSDEVGEGNWDLVTHLATARLVVSNRNETTRIETVEIVHEALIKAWSNLKDWIDEDDVFLRWQKRLEVAFLEWERNQKKEGYLLQGAPLGEAEGYLQQRLGDISKDEQDFIKKGLRRRRRTILGLTSGLVAVSIFAVGAVWQWRQAEITKSDVMARSADILFSQGRELDALMEGLRARVLVQRLKAEPSIELRGTLQQVVSEVRERNRLETHSSLVKSVSFSPDGKTLASGSDDETIKLWDITTGKEIRAIQGHKEWVQSVSFSPDGKTLASGSGDKTIKLWNVTTGKEISTIQGHSEVLHSVSFSPDGKTLASGSGDKTIKLWDVTTGKAIRPLQGHSDRVLSVSFSPDGKTLVSGSGDKTIKLWDVTTGKPIRTLQGHSDRVLSVSFSPDGKTLVSGSGDKTIKLWDVTTGKPIRTLQGHKEWVQSVSFSPDGKTLASGSEDDTIKLWDITTGKEIRAIQGHKEWVKSVSFSHDSKTLASGSDDKTIKLWDVTTGKEIRTLQGHSNSVQSVSFSPDGKTLASGSGDDTIKLWDVTTGKEIRTLQGHSIFVRSISFSPDGKTLASGSFDETIKLWDVTTGKEIRTLQGHSDSILSVLSVSFSPDAKTLASGSRDNTIKLWDVTTGKAIRTLQGHSGWVSSVSFSPDGKTLASGSYDNTIKLWDISTGKEIHTLQGYSGPVKSVSFNPDGKTLASGSGDNTIKLWDVTTGKEIRTLQGHSSSVNSVSFSPDGKTLASGSEDKTVILWNVNFDDLLVRGCDKVRAYLHNPSANVSDSDRHLCDGIGKGK